MYTWQSGVNFQDGLNQSHHTVVFDDKDQSVAPPTAGVRSVFEEVIALSNNVPYPVESAHLENKGRVFAFPALLTFASNFTSQKVIKHLTKPQVFWRRFELMVQVSAKKEFSKNPELPEMERMINPLLIL